jgi:hypothetical protein
MHWTGALAAARHWPGAQLHLTEGLGHQRIIQDHEVVRRVMTFLTDGSPVAGPPGQGEAR